jgi:hypothetical protein
MLTPLLDINCIILTHPCILLSMCGVTVTNTRYDISRHESNTKTETNLFTKTICVYSADDFQLSTPQPVRTLTNTATHDQAGASSGDVRRDVISRGTRRDVFSRDMRRGVISRDMRRDVISRDMRRGVISPDMRRDVISRDS